MRKPLSNRQFLDSELLCVTFDSTGTPVVTDGQNQCTVVRSNGNGTRDRITITFKKAIWGMVPSWVGNAKTADCQFKDIAGTSTVLALVIDCVKTSNAATTVTDAAGTILIFGPTVTKEGNY